ncbi:TPA: hypothetical protein HA317_02855 [Candidatus Woesearchaeota archaeon]|nr:hypothetical protein [Candidatus Woesearchaeota archaeon]
MRIYEGLMLLSDHFEKKFNLKEQKGADEQASKTIDSVAGEEKGEGEEEKEEPEMGPGS